MDDLIVRNRQLIACLKTDDVGRGNLEVVEIGGVAPTDKVAGYLTVKRPEIGAKNGLVEPIGRGWDLLSGNGNRDIGENAIDLGGVVIIAVVFGRVVRQGVVEMEMCAEIEGRGEVGTIRGHAADIDQDRRAWIDEVIGGDVQQPV